MQKKDKVVAVIGDTDTVTGFLLAGIGESKEGVQNFFVTNDSTTREQIQKTFIDFTQRPNIAVILISQNAGTKIRDTLDTYRGVTPVVLEIPSKGSSYDPDTDPLFGGESY